jgi:uncharacterized membrane protein
VSQDRRQPAQRTGAQPVSTTIHADHDDPTASRFARISFVQAVLVVLMVLVATAMARGYGVPAQ